MPETTPGGRSEADPTREILHGRFSLVRRGCAWRMLLHDLPPWRIVYDDVGTWRRAGTWPRMHDLAPR